MNLPCIASKARQLQMQKRDIKAWGHIGGENLSAILNSLVPLHSMAVETVDDLTENWGDKFEE